METSCSAEQVRLAPVIRSTRFHLGFYIPPRTHDLSCVFLSIIHFSFRGKPSSRAWET
jgi:hypothetical protein